LTAYARTEERTKALVSGFSMHVPKPVEPSELLAVLASLATGFKRDHSPSERP
jgi:CheY-like chemotaxis protein